MSATSFPETNSGKEVPQGVAANRCDARNDYKRVEAGSVKVLFSITYIIIINH